MKKNVLFITGQFLPYTKSVGGILRVYSFLQTLKIFIENPITMLV